MTWREENGYDGFQDFPDDASFISEIIKFGETKIQGAKPYRKYLAQQRIAFNQNRTKVLYTEILFVSNIPELSPYSKVWPDRNKWQNAMDYFSSETTFESVKKGKVSGMYSWTFAISQKSMVNNMFLGIGVVLGVSLLALTVSTGNIIVSFFAFVCISGILTNVLALMYLYGWSLGVAESVRVVISVGFSFDYVSHMATAYVESPKSLEKMERTRRAITDLGISILAGALSTTRVQCYSLHRVRIVLFIYLFICLCADLT